jgi:dTDP-4-amino-4,6-dideoxygalactose transaminase
MEKTNKILPDKNIRNTVKYILSIFHKNFTLNIYYFLYPTKLCIMILNQPVKIKIRTVNSGPAGNLSFIESSRDLPFSIKRVYYLYGLNENYSRGFHAHRTLYQCFMVLRGYVELHLEGSAGTFHFELSQPDDGVLIPPAYWREMHRLSSDTVIIVLASDDYDESDYIRNYDEFRSWLRSQNKEKAVPYVDLCRQLISFKDTESTLGQVIKSGHFINGPQVERFESDFASFIGVEYVIGVGNGLDALTLILDALGIGNGDEVIVCAAGFVATALAVSRLGAQPVFVDCLPDANMDPFKLKDALSERTKAIIPTHLYGFPAEMKAINKFAAEQNLHVIEDACQAHGAFYHGKACGSLGLAAAFSFYPTKNLGAFGDGGCVATDDKFLADRVRQLSNYGSLHKYQHDIIGYNSRLDELQAAVLRIKLPHLTEWNNRRKQLSATYDQAFKNIEGLELAHSISNTSPSLHVYAIRVKNGLRDKLASFLKDRNIETNIHYPVAIHQQNCYFERFSSLSFPEAEKWAKETLSLPLDASHIQSEIDRVCSEVSKFFK